MIVSYFTKAYHLFQRFVELKKTGRCDICDFNKKTFEEQYPEYLAFLDLQRVESDIFNVDGKFRVWVSYKGKDDTTRLYDTEIEAQKIRIKVAFKILNEQL
jgi:hypothetical protein